MQFVGEKFSITEISSFSMKPAEQEQRQTIEKFNRSELAMKQFTKFLFHH
jgi:hypothetical protein